MKNLSIWASMATLLAVGCGNPQPTEPPLFTKLPSDKTGIKFSNTLEYDKDFNIYKYRNFYNGGGVAIGDINNDGLPDVYMTSNTKHNKLYLNKGNMQFEDITDKAGCAGTKSWATGVTMADVNADGFLDIYVCNSGDIKGGSRENELFINNGNNTFTEKAAEYGLADRGLTTHAAFFDFDRDGDLDCYILNNSFRAIGSFNLQKNLRDTRDSLGGHKLMRNDKGKFTDVSAEAGIFGSVQAFGLGVMVGDINKDGWQDIYVCNDFFERDYLYINQKNGRFKESFEEQFGHCSAASMGADLADVNNDGYPDIFNTEMLPENNHRIKMKTTFDDWNRYQYYITNGYYHQFTHNSLQINNGNNTFSEVAFAAGVGATDWSWGALLCDLDNDGHKDLYIANGIYKDLTDQDFINFISDEQTKRSAILENGVDWKKLIDAIPSDAIPNYAYRNNGDGTFTNKAQAWGLGEPSFSNGAAYADLDNDGDLDLVVNNVNMEAFVYQNEANQRLQNNKYLKFILQGEGQNTQALGTKITVKKDQQTYYIEQMPMRGFQSSMDYRPHLGLGNLAQVDSVIVDFPNGKRTVLRQVATNQTLVLKQAEALETTPLDVALKPLFAAVTPQYIDAKHTENIFSDFDVERLLFFMHSTEGAKLAVGDVDGNGTEDVFLGGARGTAGQLFLQKNGRFIASKQADFDADKEAEDIGVLFFDADGDKDLDLFVASGGSDGVSLGDRLYKNDGKGGFKRDPNAFALNKDFATSVARATDFDGDGFLDLFIGGRFRPNNYGEKTSSYLLKNDGQGHFKGMTNERAPEFKDLGMVTDAQWADLDGDKDMDLVVVGEWMAVTVFINDKGQLKNTTAANGLAATQGLWQGLHLADVDKDGDLDILAGNFGYNSRLRADAQHPVTMYYGDFDNNTMSEQLICIYEGDQLYPCVLRHNLAQQVPSMKKKYPDYKSYADEPVNKVLSETQMRASLKYEAKTLASAVIINKGGGQFEYKALPFEAQFSPTFSFLTDDFDKDGHVDILLGGNFFEAKPEMGRMDANYGRLLRGDGKGGFTPLSFSRSGLNIRGQVRDMARVKVGKQSLVFVAQNNDKVLVYNPL